MEHTLRTALAASLAVLVVLPLQPTTAAGPAPLLAPSGTWRMDALSPAVRANVTADVSLTNPSARQAIDLVDGSVAIDLDTRVCGAGFDSCSYGQPPGAPTPWRIHLSRDTSGGTYDTQRFIVLHEIGHAVWNLVFDRHDREAFARAVDRALRGAPCRRVGVESGQPCARTEEVFGDEFARWAGGFERNLTGYYTPTLLAAPTMQGLVDTAVAHHATL
jgi:hypothetical protein